MYIVMPLLEMDLYDLIRANRNPFNEITVRSIMQQILQGLAHLHSKGIIHCDLKTSNIM